MNILYLYLFCIYLYLFYWLKSHQRITFVLITSLTAIGFFLPIISLFSVIIYSYTVYKLTKIIDKYKSPTALFLSLLILILPLIGIRFIEFFFSSTNNEILGISFYFFGSAALLIDRFNNSNAEKSNFLKILSYNSLFPKFICGPVQSWQDFIANKFKFELNQDEIILALKTIIIAIFIKSVIVDRLSTITDDFYSNPRNHSGVYVGLIMILYIYQIYYDFSSYSNIAIGAGSCLGFKFPQNFNRPYLSTSISDYWRRWHMSLMYWFFKYIFTPLTAYLRYFGKYSIFISLYIVMIASSLWHGFDMHFIAFGILHASAMCIQIWTKNIMAIFKSILGLNIYNAICWIMTFTFICFVDVLFRAEYIEDAIQIWKSLFYGLINDVGFIYNQNLSIFSIKALLAGLPIPKSELLLLCVTILILESISIIKSKYLIIIYRNTYLNYFIYSIIILFCTFFNANNDLIKFSYSQF